MKENNISSDRKKYLKKVKKEKLLIIFVQISILVIFIITWEILAKKGIIDSFITSQPSRIVKTFLNLSSNGLLKHLGVTLTETLIGFSMGVVIGTIIAITLWWSNFLSKVSEPFLVVLNSLPKVALRSCYYNMGWCRNGSNYNYGACNFFNCNNNGNIKWIFKYRQRIDKNGTNF